MTHSDLARLALNCLDLTSLHDDDTDESIDALAERAATPHGAPAALCVYPAYIGAARAGLDARGLDSVKIATVVNFPGGEDPPDAVADQVEAALDAGADEIDAVLPWRALRDGDDAAAAALVRACRAACAGHLLKIILESGELQDAALIRRASDIALAEGADFLKTSTGKVPINATPAAVAQMLGAIVAAGSPCGIKIAGGVSTLVDVAGYVQQVHDALGAAALQPQRLRFGASGLLPVLLAAIEGRAEGGAAAGY